LNGGKIPKAGCPVVSAEDGRVAGVGFGNWTKRAGNTAQPIDISLWRKEKNRFRNGKAALEALSQTKSHRMGCVANERREIFLLVTGIAGRRKDYK
jgi:hypothetical protein